MVILGIDPGTAIVGWAIIDKDGPRMNLIACGAITTPTTETIEGRLALVYKGMNQLFETYKPDCMAIEQLFFSTNVKTAISVAQARGVMLLAAEQHNVEVISYGPLTVKQTITGDGKADKKQMQQMVAKSLHLKAPPKPDDVADAVAIAMTHGYIDKSVVHKVKSP